jgi:hypothetical protein
MERIGSSNQNRIPLLPIETTGSGRFAVPTVAITLERSHRWTGSPETSHSAQSDRRESDDHDSGQLPPRRTRRVRSHVIQRVCQGAFGQHVGEARQ